MKKILIIDADIDFVNALGAELENAGYAVMKATRAADGLPMAPNADLAIVCVELPDQNGFVVCSQLKKTDSPTADLPVFLTSATQDGSFDRHITLANHADGYFYKPIDIDVMLQEIAAFFGGSDDEPYADENLSNDAADADAPKNIAQNDAESDELNIFGDIDVHDLDLELEDSDDFNDAPETSNPPEAAPAVEPPKPVAVSPIGQTAPPPISSIPASPFNKPAGLPRMTPSLSKATKPFPPPPAADRLNPPASQENKPLSSASISLLSPNRSTSQTGLTPSLSGTGRTAPLTDSGLSASLSSSRLQPATDRPSASGSFSSISHPAIPAADLSRLSDEITVLNNEITVLKSEITTRDNRINLLQSQVDAMKTRCQNAESIAEAVRADADQALSDKMNADAVVQQMNADRYALEQDLQNVTAELQTTKAQLEAVNADLANMSAELNAYKEKLASANDAVKNLLSILA